MQFIPSNINIDFISRQKYFFIGSGVFIILSILASVVIGPNYGIDFAGGSEIILAFDGEISSDDVRKTMNDLGFTDAEVQTFGSDSDYKFMIRTQQTSVMAPEKISGIKTTLADEIGVITLFQHEEGHNQIYLRFEEAVNNPAQTSDEESGITKEELNKTAAQDIKKILAKAEIEGAFIEPYGDQWLVVLEEIQAEITNGFYAAYPKIFNKDKGVERVETVGPRVGAQLRDDGVVSMIFVLIAILIYIAVRFDIRFAPAAVAALLHDVVLTIGLFVILDKEFSLPIIAALLTIVGYSLNDTIVVFDRIRENMGQLKTLTISQIVNKSINETLSRTILTSITTLFAVSSLYFFGGGLISDFSFAMIIGVFVGTYSSIFVASPIVIYVDKFLEKRKKRTAPKSRTKKAKA